MEVDLGKDAFFAINELGVLKSKKTAFYVSGVFDQAQAEALGAIVLESCRTSPGGPPPRAVAPVALEPVFDPAGPVLGIDPGVSCCGYGAVGAGTASALEAAPAA